MQLSTDTTNPILSPALKVGAVTGVAGVLVGGANAILRGSPNMGLFSVLTGVNCALLGSSYWASRATILRALHNAETSLIRPRDKAYASGVSGALSGSFIALVTGMEDLPPDTWTVGEVASKPRSVVPGALVWGLVGLVGQSAYNIADARHTQYIAQKAERQLSGGLGFWGRAMRSKWSPVTRLTTREYEDMLKEKLLVLEADLALANEEIERLERARRREQETKKEEPKKKKKEL